MSSSVQPIAFRLTRGADLKQSIFDAVKANQIQAGCVVSVVGCLSSLNMRLADSTTVFQKNACFEILSLSGTLTPEHLHLHISVADEEGRAWGGHLLDGTIVSHTAEVCLLVFPSYQFAREFDADTGYTELVVKTGM
ncbi:PPC domain-containing DNA-binding protein [Enterovibrio calviensis]|uniref:PPC domain-containing DNA-binding protein n=1 Tax=Enterovibrio calviensis TaxID=91359 RepID=UPI000485FF55|nr:PPC domain-containing DNA-binding protein [Enterovibrio calviensis]